MTGPSLKQLHAHHAIHSGGLAGAVQMTMGLKEAISDQAPKEEIRSQMKALLDYWKNRIISHADAEEEDHGFYAECVEKNPDLKDAVIKLTRDHDLMRQIAADIEPALEGDFDTLEVLTQFEALTVINEHHSRDEEKFLLGG
ncbi:hypothetical protein KP77_07470 [Jeotgalibacillus alimentarius]|uniref:Hemerythrin-like domain-containing protein n=1 Tax=Jeotgalibacillus alimentarius TaxID=135826 RepID=A0A0C2RLT9_9BACL|nr:hemerythrin domain-containing protein [Jeotgalibacillus alimentarius]KIL51235.1 hypothetical protein KP77_07470 [Jeotgalibacillus alimentarius]